MKFQVNKKEGWYKPLNFMPRNLCRDLVCRLWRWSLSECKIYIKENDNPKVWWFGDYRGLCHVDYIVIDIRHGEIKSSKNGSMYSCGLWHSPSTSLSIICPPITDLIYHLAHPQFSSKTCSISLKLLMVFFKIWEILFLFLGRTVSLWPHQPKSNKMQNACKWENWVAWEKSTFSCCFPLWGQEVAYQRFRRLPGWVFLYPLQCPRDNYESQVAP